MDGMTRGTSGIRSHYEVVDLGLIGTMCTSAVGTGDIPLERVREENQKLELGSEWR